MLKLRDNAGARRKKKLVGRGIGSGRGKTSCRGGKGQTARSGVAIGAFEGGQTPLYMRLPKRGFKNYCRNAYSVINFDDIRTIVDLDHLDNGVITLDHLKKIGKYNGKKSVKLLSRGNCDRRFDIEVHSASKAAIEKLEAIGGKVQIISK